jgi:phosphate uptake regulator
MYQRKVQKTGGSTYFVTLPKDWAEEVGIGPGTVVTLMPNDSGALLLVPAALSMRNHCVIRLQNWNGERLHREIISRYIVGFDVIELQGERIRPAQRRMIREVAQSLVGLEIFDESQSNVVLHALVNVRDFPVHKTLNRIFDITRAMVGDAVSAFCQHDEELARDVIERDGDVDRLTLLVARQFSLLLRDLMLEEDFGLSRLQFLHYNEAADQLERVADHSVKISEATIALESPVNQAVAAEIEARAKNSMAILERAVEAYAAQDIELANAVLEEREKEEKQFSATRRSAADKQPDAAASISIVMDSLVRIREYGFNIAENALDAPASNSSRGNGS